VGCISASVTQRKAVGTARASPTRDRCIEALDLALEGSRLMKGDVDRAIQKCEQATKLDPANHRIWRMLAVAYQRKEDWDRVASTMARAVHLAPDFADYWFWLGYARVRQGGRGEHAAYEKAKEPLRKCIEKDPNLAECYHFLGEASLWTDDNQVALENYTKAIEHDPGIAYFYPPLAELYIVLRSNEEAEQVLKAGMAMIKPSEKTAPNLYGMYILLFMVAQARDDYQTMISAMEKAQQVAGDTHPEIEFSLGSTYAVMKPPRKEEAFRWLDSFHKRACRGASAAKFKDQCETANSLLLKLGQ
jgi:tetratricopeptide (TPR) repeat protein